MMSNKKKTAVTWLMILLGIVMVVLGFTGGQIILPPIITGLGFFVIAWGIN